MTAKPSRRTDEPAAALLLQLSTLAGYQQFGEYLRTKRKQFGMTQAEMGALLPTLTEQTYGYLERERRAPLVEELVPLFAALVELQDSLHLPPMQVLEAQTYFRLAKAVIERKQRKREVMTLAAWQDIERQIIALVSPDQHGGLRLVTLHAANVESLDSHRRKALRDLLHTDVSTLLEREAWVEEAMSLLQRTPPIKVSVVQGGMGAGKSHALALLAQRLAQQEELYLIPYKFEQSESMRPEDHLDVFLATLLADLTFQASDEAKQRPLEERIGQALKVLFAYEKPVVLLLDDAQQIFPDANSWSLGWHQFFSKWMSGPHTTKMFLMTRTWPGWDERQLSFMREDNMPDLSQDAAMQIWKRRGFDDVEDGLLRAVCEKCGTNPQIIEMLTFQYKRRSYVAALGEDAGMASAENTNTRNLRRLLASETLFSNLLDATTRRTLQQVFTNRFSGETRQLLELLAVSPLPFPFRLLLDQLDYFVRL